MKRIVILLSALGAIYFPGLAQKGFFSTANAYLGQQQPGDTPQLFAPGLLVPDSGISMDRSAFSKDGREFYYVNAQHWFSAKGSKIRYFRFVNGKWQGPADLNEGYYAPTFSIDGNFLFLEGGKRDSTQAIIWRSRRNGDGWDEPEVYLRAQYGLYDFMPTVSGTCYVGSNAMQGKRRDFTTYDFCSLSFSNGDTLIRSLGPVINTPGFDGDFYVAPDESYLVISYQEKPDYECKLAISFRRRDHSWSPPVDLGPLINVGDAHRWGEYVSPDGKFLFYSKGTSEKDCALYWVRFDRLLKKLRGKAAGAGQGSKHK